MKKEILKKLDRLDQDTTNIYDSLKDISEKDLHNTAYGWSIVQVMAHLNDAESASLKYMQKKSQAGDKMGDAAMANSFRMWLTNMALKSSLKWKAPSYIASPPVYTFEEVQSKWAETRKEINSFVQAYPEEWINKLVYKHPMGGRQNLGKAVDSFIYHQIHHVHQINRIRKKLSI